MVKKYRIREKTSENILVLLGYRNVGYRVCGWGVWGVCVWGGVMEDLGEDAVFFLVIF